MSTSSFPLANSSASLSSSFGEDPHLELGVRRHKHLLHAIHPGPGLAIPAHPPTSDGVHLNPHEVVCREMSLTATFERALKSSRSIVSHTSLLLRGWQSSSCPLPDQPASLAPSARTADLAPRRTNGVSSGHHGVVLGDDVGERAEGLFAFLTAVHHGAS